jgi:hypothetical protein
VRTLHHHKGRALATCQEQEQIAMLVDQLDLQPPHLHHKIQAVLRLVTQSTVLLTKHEKNI